MSHNITLSDVKFTDLNILRNVVKQLSGDEAKLDMNAKTFRTFPGQPNTCDAAIQMPGNHDIGLNKQSDGYTPVFDPYSMSRVFSNQFGGPIGGLTQEYILQQAEYEAAQHGMTAQRVPGERGQVTLELVAND